MELKKYQRKVLNTIREYARLTVALGTGAAAYDQLLAQDGLFSGHGDIRWYVDDVNGAPKVCVKVPTGGGKTYIAANALHVLTEELDVKTRAVVWLVPRNEILRQTLRQLRDPSHPLRMAIDRDFSHRVEVLDKEDGLAGRGLNGPAVEDQLTVFVLSYDSFKNKDGRRAYAENSSLVALTNYQKSQGDAVEVDGADDTALITALAGMHPIVVVDESHHAKSNLSIEMLRNLNPCFILELTATPSNKSNVIARVSAQELKAEEMVKLPVIVYRRDGKTETIQDAIMLRRRLEQIAAINEEKTGHHIRPIALLQAERKGADNAATFRKLKEKLVDAGIPEEHIAIRTGDVDELGGTDLQARGCPIRYVITVEALSEGWDCPFAYVLATVANKTSRTSVEQLVGRVLRQPYAQHAKSGALNTSYVLTSSADFNATIDQVVAGLNGAGFSKRDVLADTTDTAEGVASGPVPVQGLIDELMQHQGTEDETGSEDEPDDFNDLAISLPDENAKLPESSQEVPDTRHVSIDAMIRTSEAAEAECAKSAKDDAETLAGGTTGMGDDMNTFRIRDTVADTVRNLRIPRYRLERQAGLFSDLDDAEGELFDRDSLLEHFMLAKIGTEDIRLDAMHVADAKQIDISSDSELKVRNLSDVQRRGMKELFARDSNEGRRRSAKLDLPNLMSPQVQKLYGAHGLKSFINRVVDQMSDDELEGYVDNASAYAAIISHAIKDKADAFRVREFDVERRRGDITITPDYAFPSSAYLPNPLTTLDRTLYEAEDGGMNELELQMADALANCEGIIWWHRVVERRKGEFYINGFINHYPDFLAMTRGGRLFVIETKGEQLKNDDSRDKLRLGNQWASDAGPNYQYFMVFGNSPMDIDGAYSFATFKTDFLNHL
ncbi:DEAD/DEAH box helicase [Bifidobacterium callitrichidarum]|nr:DEAD/DEAH box helicase family protein [Bifidobacterium callitrichidarum]